MRVDVFLVQYGYVPSRQKAKVYIESGLVLVDGREIMKCSELIDDCLPHKIEIREGERYVGRGGIKLEGALRAFEFDVTGKRCLDIGASTGGFTDCLLQHGASSVSAIDSGRNQLHERLKHDVRVTSYEGCNARSVTIDFLGGDSFDVVVMDVSFISQTLIIPNIAKGLLAVGGHFVTLIKPQFEAGRQALGKNGIVKKAFDRRMAVKRVIDSAQLNGFRLEGIIESPIQGGDGNIEYLAFFVFDGNSVDVDFVESEKMLSKLFGKS